MKLNPENQPISYQIIETTPDALRIIAERLERQASQATLANQVVTYSPEPSQIWVYKPEKAMVHHD